MDDTGMKVRLPSWLGLALTRCPKEPRMFAFRSVRKASLFFLANEGLCSGPGGGDLMIQNRRLNQPITVTSL